MKIHEKLWKNKTLKSSNIVNLIFVILIKSSTERLYQVNLINHDITYIVLPCNYEDNDCLCVSVGLDNNRINEENIKELKQYEDNIFIISNDVLKEYIPDKIYAVIDDQIELIKSKYLFEDWIENNKLLDLESDNKYKHTYLDKIKTGNIKNPNNKLFVK